MLNKEFEPKRFHFIAIGGIGMSGLAKYLLEMGAQVSGSDIADSKYCDELRKLGAKIYIGHDAKNVPENSMVVVSSAVKENNVELLRAKELNCGIIHRSEALKLLSLGFGLDEKPKFIGFAGTHGKTTTSGLCSFVLNKANTKASYVVGGIIPDFATNAKFYDGAKYFVAELDESDGTIVKYSPNTFVVNNLEADHPDFYKNGLDDVIKTFKNVLNNLGKDAKILINSDNEGCKRLANECHDKTFITYGLNSGVYRAENIVYSFGNTSFEVVKNSTKLGKIELSVIGEHNVYNALAVAVAIYENEGSLEKYVQYFKDFTGMGRRMQKKAEIGSISIFDDYAHHPSEIKATLSAVSGIKKDRRLVTIFQPHRYTRFKSLWNDFLQAFDKTDKLIVLDVYSAGDTKDETVSSQKFVNQIKHNDAAFIDGNMQEVAKKIMPLLKKNDIVITMGAGDVTKIGNYLTDLYNGEN